MFGFSKTLLAAITALLLIAVITLFALLAIMRISAMIESAARVATEAEAARWRAEISRVNAEAAQKVAEQARHALAIEASANARINEASQAYEELRRRNEALPDGALTGLGRDRARLLPK